jgi:hypothetical protein
MLPLTRLPRKRKPPFGVEFTIEPLPILEEAIAARDLDINVGASRPLRLLLDLVNAHAVKGFV